MSRDRVIFDRRIWLFLASEKSSKDIINNDTESDDEVVASDVPLRYLFQQKSLLALPGLFVRFPLLFPFRTLVRPFDPRTNLGHESPSSPSPPPPHCGLEQTRIET